MKGHSHELLRVFQVIILRRSNLDRISCGAELHIRIRDPNAFLTPGSGIWNGGKTDPDPRSGMITGIGLSHIIFPRA
jgi:hypothetical protein